LGTVDTNGRSIRKTVKTYFLLEKEADRQGDCDFRSIATDFGFEVKFEFNHFDRGLIKDHLWSSDDRLLFLVLAFVFQLRLVLWH